MIARAASLRLSCGAPIAVAALLPDASADGWERSLEMIAASDLEPTRDIYLLDLRLARLLEASLPRGTIAGASVEMWRGGLVSGGVVGSVHDRHESAGGGLEIVAEGIWCWAAPGGPGFVLRSDRRGAEAARDAMLAAPDASIGSWEIFRSHASVCAASEYIFVCDGSGQRGMAAVKGANGTFVEELLQNSKF